jgi:mRNA-degrading endonuclease HigB of HigAB toxin-antitoxin module
MRGRFTIRLGLVAGLVAGLLVVAAAGLAGPQAQELARDAVAVVTPSAVEEEAQPSAAAPETSQPAPEQPSAAPKTKPASNAPVVRSVARPSAPAAAQQYEPAKRIICHHARVIRRIGGVRFRVVKHVSISVRQSFVRRHRLHGDTLGRCTTAANKRAHKAKAHVRRWHKPIRLRG